MSRRKKREQQEKVNWKDVLGVFRSAGHPLRTRELLKTLRLHKNLTPALEDILDDLTRRGKIIRSGKAWGLVEKMPMLPGRLEVQRSGVGFVIPEDKRRKDVFVNPDNFGGAWHGDRVMVAILPGRGGKNQSGRVVRILERGRTSLAVRVVKTLGADQLLAKPTELRLAFSLVVDTSALDVGPHAGDILLVVPGEQIEDGLWAATAERHLGRERDLEVQEAIVKTNHAIPTDFPPEVRQAALELPQVPRPEDFARRHDLRGLPFVTIDGAKARDFDDAILVQARDGGFTLHVAIADVSHYVPSGGVLDSEAMERANSYYFPRSVEPMFPEALSNGLCSLNPDVPRLVMVAEMDFDPRGRRSASRLYAAVIQSQARLTYSLVKRALLDKEVQARQDIAPVLPMIEEAERLARLLQKRRSKRGSLDFDLPEPEILFNLQGETVDIRPKIRHFGHQLIEEFMIAANEAVAEFLRDREAVCLYRIHPEPDPDKLEALIQLLKRSSVGSSLPEETDVKGLQALLALVDGSDLEFLVNRMLLRTMMQAKYSPVNEAHFGLASECYCHFTSPIRRYADLVVHRSLKAALGLSPGLDVSPQHLLRTADHLNVQERKAMDAEREIFSRLTIIFLEDKVGQTFTGIIASMSDYGFWVELNEVMAEGMVRLSSLMDDYYVFWPEQQTIVGERTGRRFSLGDKARVILREVNLSRQEITLEMVTDEPTGLDHETGRLKPEKKKAKTGNKRQQRGERSGH